MRTKISETQENKQVAGSADDQKPPLKANVTARKPRVAPSKAKWATNATLAKKVECGRKARKTRQNTIEYLFSIRSPPSNAGRK